MKIDSTTGDLASGGGIFATHFAPVTLSQSVIDGNSTASGGGGGIFAFGHVLLTESRVTNNSTAGTRAHGGGIHSNRSNNPGSGSLTLNNSIVSGNSVTGESSSGGGIYTKQLETVLVHREMELSLDER